MVEVDHAFARLASRASPLIWAMMAAGCATPEPAARDTAERISEVHITPFVGASVEIEYRGTVIHIDPYGRGDYSDAKQADLILVTDTPGDHLDPEMIRKLRKPGAPVVVSDRPEDARDEPSRQRLLQVTDAIVMDNGDHLTLAGVEVQAVPMYDLIPGDPFHAKGEGNGYILTLGGETRVYLAGVTECVPEMRDVHDIDIAFIPMNLPHGRMPPGAAAECVKMIRPSVVYPYHYREQPIDEFVQALSGEPDIEVRAYDWYPQPAS